MMNLWHFTSMKNCSCLYWTREKDRTNAVRDNVHRQDQNPKLKVEAAVLQWSWRTVQSCPTLQSSWSRNFSFLNELSHSNPVSETGLRLIVWCTLAVTLLSFFSRINVLYSSEVSLIPVRLMGDPSAPPPQPVSIAFLYKLFVSTETEERSRETEKDDVCAVHDWGQPFDPTEDRRRDLDHDSALIPIPAESAIRHHCLISFRDWWDTLENDGKSKDTVNSRCLRSSLYFTVRPWTITTMQTRFFSRSERIDQIMKPDLNWICSYSRAPQIEFGGFISKEVNLCSCQNGKEKNVQSCII